MGETVCVGAVAGRLTWPIQKNEMEEEKKCPDVSDFSSHSISGAEIIILIIPPLSNLSPNTDAAICLLCLIALSPLSRPNYFLSYLIIFANDLIRE